ncbi:MAG: 3-dehydroquinate synthase [Desulfohalobiaceae bacterium]
MRRLDVQGASGTSRILIGQGLLEDLPRQADQEEMVVITDQRVAGLYQERFPTVPLIIIPQGEEHKALDTVQHIYQELLALEADRSTCVVGIGGGMVCDVAGFAASTYLRGLHLGLAPSSLLAQVDASVGGKNGVNFQGYKNLVGVFRQPEFVLCDLDLLQSLDAVDIGCGFAEIVKHAAIADAKMFELLEQRAQDVLSLEPDCLQRLVYDSVRIKAEIVNQDELEKGQRRKLNFGHTFGHALEKVQGLPHGQAVSLGMALAARLSVSQGLLAADKAQRLIRLLQALDLPVKIQGDPQELLEALGKDKKRQGQSIHFVLLEDIGRAVVRPLGLQQVRQALLQLAAGNWGCFAQRRLER